MSRKQPVRAHPRKRRAPSRRIPLLALVLLVGCGIGVGIFVRQQQASGVANYDGVKVAAPTASAVFTVSDKVAQTGVEAVGLNLDRLMSGTNLVTNNLWDGGGFEPFVYRLLVRVERTGVDKKKGEWIEWQGGGGIHFWDSYATGFANGAEARVYRLVNKRGKPLRFSSLTDASGAHHVERIGTANVPGPSPTLKGGGWISEGMKGENRVYLDKKLGLRRGDYVFFKKEQQYIPRKHINKRLYEYEGTEKPYVEYSSNQTTGRLVPHPGPIPGDFVDRGRTCLRVTAKNADWQWVGRYAFHSLESDEGQWYSQLTPGARYRVKVWLRQENLGDQGRVRFVFEGNQSYAAANQKQPWQVTGLWRQYEYAFQAPGELKGLLHAAPAFQFTGPGRLWIDNVELYREDAGHRPFGPVRLAMDEILKSLPKGRKPAVRMYPLSYKIHSLEGLLGKYPDGNYHSDGSRIHERDSISVGQTLEWALATGSSPQSRVVPYLTFAEELLEEEWMAIVEYLGVPYDPKRDTPKKKPWAHRRYVQRGNNGTPWTAEFREVLLEYGNETWHNGAGGYGWHGFSAPDAVHAGGLEYGLFARYMFDEHVMKMPAWAKYDLGKKIKLVLGGNYEADPNLGYGELAVQRSPNTRYVGHANYVGPKWETGDKGSETFNDAGVQATLMGRVTMMQDMIVKAARTRDKLNRQRSTKYELIAYEGGPSGYWTNREKPEVDELYGKSLAMGVAALDTWLFSSLNGFKHQCFYRFGAGRLWTSHTPPYGGGFRPHVGWLALRLRNRYAEGTEMLTVTGDRVPGLSSPAGRLPAIAVYALRDGKKSTSVFVLSRKLDGGKLGDGYTSVTLRLPFDRPQKVTLYKLAHPDGTPADPRENNLEPVGKDPRKLRVDIVTQRLAADPWSRDFTIDASTGGGPNGMPPGTAYLYVFEHP